MALFSCVFNVGAPAWQLPGASLSVLDHSVSCILCVGDSARCKRFSALPYRHMPLLSRMPEGNFTVQSLLDPQWQTATITCVSKGRTAHRLWMLQGGSALYARRSATVHPDSNNQISALGWRARTPGTFLSGVHIAMLRCYVKAMKCWNSKYLFLAGKLLTAYSLDPLYSTDMPFGAFGHISSYKLSLQGWKGLKAR